MVFSPNGQLVAYVVATSVNRTDVSLVKSR